MIIWIYFPLISLLFAYLAKPNSLFKINYRLYQALLVIWLAWFVSFGGGAMTDQENYKVLYLSCENNQLFGFIEILQQHYFNLTESRNTYEIGYVFLNILFNKLGLGYVGFLFIIALFTNSLLVSFIYRYDTPVISVLILIVTSLYSQQANLVRQMMAASIFLYAIKYIETKNLYKYFLFIIAASLIHMSAIFLFVFYFFADKKLPKYFMIILWFLTVYIAYFQVAFPFLSTIEFYYYKIGIQKFDREIEEAGINLVSNLLMGILFLFKGQDKDINRKYNLIFNLFFVGILFGNLTTISFAFYRVSLYFSIFSIIIIPKLPFYISSSFLKELVPGKLIYKMSYFLVFLFYANMILRKAYTTSDIILGTKMYSVLDVFK